MKKFIAIALMSFSLSAFAYVENAVDSLLQVLPFGTHKGVDDAGVACDVSVSEVNFPNKEIIIKVTKKTNSIFKNVSAESDFLFRAWKKEFIQTDRYYIDETRSAYVDRIIRTVDAGNSKLYVVVADEVTVNRESKVDSVDCVIF